MLPWTDPPVTLITGCPAGGNTAAAWARNGMTQSPGRKAAFLFFNIFFLLALNRSTRAGGAAQG
jgi:hypothetical protein